MMIIIFIELCRIADSLLWIPKSSRRTSSTFYIPNIIRIPISWRRTSSIFCIPNIIAFINNGIPTIISTFTHFSIIALLKMESQQLSQNSPTLQNVYELYINIRCKH
ncbi:HLJ1_G0012300.mRNA.1.CDS.1 [Saccharomyces cerevisiae]|nr:HLJ1_G0012300.mRNA.1.CDS.1 [Saccharomyces cerevisiae]